MLGLLMARDAVIFDTPAAVATSISVTPRGGTDGERAMLEAEGGI
ncbi:hypothetical protein WKW82_13835 [Variovorax rhizosphaerae]|uniref:Uncharacterized protein n=1 Tax=Variovorax rhizosphaerae TaxID=1836200 RepID=A0ABU8WJN5_9BURK